MLANQILGLSYVADWLTEQEESSLLENIQAGDWELSLQRRVQQFGPMYDYKTRKLKASCKDIPSWIKYLYPKMMTFFKEEPNQIIINEYEKGQGITKHVDANVFGPTIASLSLLSNTDMTFGQYRGSETKQILEKRSLIVMSGEARSKWYHYISPVAEKRISITFRTTLEE